MKKVFAFIFILIFVLSIVGCKDNAPGGEIQIGREFDLSDVTQITLVNGHNGYSTTITDKTDMANIIFFVGETIGKPIGNGKGYYEGSYSVVFSFDNDEEFFLRYGDDTVFYIGEGDDDYPIRYRLIHMNISDDVIPFFSQYDKSGMIWNETN